MLIAGIREEGGGGGGGGGHEAQAVKSLTIRITHFYRRLYVYISRIYFFLLSRMQNIFALAFYYYFLGGMYFSHSGLGAFGPSYACKSHE